MSGRVRLLTDPGRRRGLRGIANPATLDPSPDEPSSDLAERAKMKKNQYLAEMAELTEMAESQYLADMAELAEISDSSDMSDIVEILEQRHYAEMADIAELAELAELVELHERRDLTENSLYAENNDEDITDEVNYEKISYEDGA